MTKFVIIKKNTGKYVFKLKSGNGKTLLTGNTHNRQEACLKNIRYIKKHANNAKRFTAYALPGNRTVFVFTVTNGYRLGRTAAFKNLDALVEDLDTIMHEAANAVIEKNND